MRQEFKFEGGKQLEAALLELKTAAAKRIGNNALKDAATPIEAAAKANAPTRRGDLKIDIHTGKKLNKRQRKLALAEKSDLEIHVGTNDPAGIQQEFGNVNHGPQAMFRPAWDAEGGQKALDRIGQTLGDEVAKAAKRAARKAMKAKGGK